MLRSKLLQTYVEFSLGSAHEPRFHSQILSVSHCLLYCRLQDKPPAGQASETGIVAGVPQAQPPTETVEQRATNEPASLASFSQSRQRRQCWKPLQAGGPAPDTADSDWGALAAEHGDRLMQLAQEAPSSLTGPEPASAGLESQIDTADSSRRHEIKLQASRINDSDSDEYADPEGSLLAGLPRAMRGLPGQLHASKPALRRKLRSTSRQQVQPRPDTHPNARMSMDGS